MQSDELRENHAARGEASATPRACALRLEQAVTGAGPGEQFVGYGVVGLPFRDGDVLAFRRFPASSIGPGYTAVWHRDRRGAWTFYSSVEPELSCPRYFGAAIERAVVAEIDVTWVGHDHLVVSIPARRVEWSARLAGSSAARLAGMVAAALPDRAWRHERLLAGIGTAAGIALGAGPLRLAGTAPNGQRYRLRPLRIWHVEAAAALVEGREIGPIGRSRTPIGLGDFRLPATGLFACGTSRFDVFDPALHIARVARIVERT